MSNASLLLKYNNDNDKQKKVFEFDNDGKTYRFAVIPHDDVFAKISGIGFEDEEVALETGYCLVGDDGGVTRMIGERFAVIWSDNYTLSFKGQEVLRLQSQRQQVVKPSEATIIVKRMRMKD